MKKVLMSILVLLCVFGGYTQIIIPDTTNYKVTASPVLTEQQTSQKWYHLNKTDYAIMGLQIVSGFASGWGDGLVYHPHTWERKYPNSDLNWWIPSKSQGRRGFMLGRDGIHSVRAIEHGANYVSIGISLLDVFNGTTKKELIKKAVFRTLYAYALNRIAFRGSYNIWLNDDVERQKAGLD